MRQPVESLPTTLVLLTDLDNKKKNQNYGRNMLTSTVCVPVPFSSYFSLPPEVVTYLHQ